MITFAVGLVLRIGERTLEFERELAQAGIQFKYQDNYQIVTFSAGDLYGRILRKEIQVVSANGQPAGPLALRTGDQIQATYKRHLSDKDTAELEFRLRFVKHLILKKVPAGSIDQIRKEMSNVEPDKEGRAHPSAWTVRHWLRLYVRTDRNPYALLDRRTCATHQKRFDRNAEHLVEAAICRHYLQFRGASARETWRRLRDEIKAKNRAQGEATPVPSESSILRRIREIGPFVCDYKRLGPGFARNKWRYSLHGDTSTRVLERVEVDHTWLDLWVLDPRTGVPIGRPWITALIDRFSGYILGIHISFYGPSVGSVASAMRNAIFPKDELLSAVPEESLSWSAMGAGEMYVLDNGLEFHAKAFLRLSWELKSDLLFNPVHQPWLKSSIERCMLEVARILPLRGKVYTPKKNVQPEDPKEGAAILFDDLCRGLMLWAADTFPNNIHPKTMVRPVDLWEEGRLASPLPMFPLSFDNFDIISGVSAERTVDGDGAFFKYLRFNSRELQDYRRTHGEKFRTELRFNPDDIGQVHILLPKAKTWLPVPLARPGLGYGGGLSLIQHEIIRHEAGKKLTRLNAEEQLARAQERLREFWNDAIDRGIMVRRDSHLVRLQGLTSAKVYGNGAVEKALALAAPELSPNMEKDLAQVMPYKHFSLEEEIA
ncbi:MAG: hypothetical protein V4505_18960 [Pseudomonadota bacterium]